MYNNIKRFCFYQIVILLFAFNNINAKNYLDIGALIGTSYYMGDINPTKVFNTPSYAFAGVVRYNFNQHYNVKFTGSYLSLSASDASSNNLYQQLRNASFSSTVIDLSSQLEFSFLPLRFKPYKFDVSPIVAAGIGTNISLAGAIAGKPKLSMPLTLGVRCAYGKVYSFGVEWNARKLFSDNFDGVINKGSKQNLFNNNDWFYFAGAFINIRLFTNDAECPAYPTK